MKRKERMEVDALLGLAAAVDLPEMRRGNLAAWFVLLASLPPTFPRMAFVLPLPVWQNENLADWRRWVRERYHITLWYTDVDIWFSDAHQGVCVALLTPIDGGQALPEGGKVAFATIPDIVDGELTEVERVPVPIANEGSAT